VICGSVICIRICMLYVFVYVYYMYFAHENLTVDVHYTWSFYNELCRYHLLVTGYFGVFEHLWLSCVSSDAQSSVRVSECEEMGFKRETLWRVYFISVCEHWDKLSRSNYLDTRRHGRGVQGQNPWLKRESKPQSSGQELKGSASQTARLLGRQILRSVAAFWYCYGCKLGVVALWVNKISCFPRNISGARCSK
jgi:hypothetical protein